MIYHVEMHDISSLNRIGGLSMINKNGIQKENHDLIRENIGLEIVP